MDLSDSQCSSSGCESGWTSYLEQSSIPKTQYQGFDGYVGGGYARVEDEKEDLSMVSDASSGPPHYFEDDEDCFDQVPKKSMNRKIKSKEVGRSLLPSYLDDTASSPTFDQRVTRNESSMNPVTGMPQGFSEKQMKGKSALKKDLGFIQQESASKEQGAFLGRKWK